MLLTAVENSPSRRFALYHKYDRNLFASYVLLVWLGIAMGFGPQIARHFAQSQPVILGLGAYDLITRGRLLPAYAAGTVGIATIQALAISLYLNPAWKPIASSIIARIG